MKIKSINKEHYKGKVYNIGTLPNHNYLANNILVHNCYQGSTPEGLHGEYKYIVNILYTLSRIGVLEIAYGGGEPMLHPNFLDILEQTKEHGISPTFTTKQTEWLKDPLYTSKVFTYAKAFAYSPSCLQDIITLSELIKQRKEDKSIPNRKQITIHLVLGTLPEAAFRSMLEFCFKENLKVTILGFKTTGFGNTYKQIDSSWWLTAYKEILNSNKNYSSRYIGIDTVVVQQYQTELDKANINPTLYYATEGSFSCYIDAVNLKVAPSSFSDKSESVAIELSKSIYNNIYPVNFTVEVFKEIFKTIQKD